MDRVNTVVLEVACFLEKPERIKEGERGIASSILS